MKHFVGVEFDMPAAIVLLIQCS